VHKYIKFKLNESLSKKLVIFHEFIHKKQHFDLFSFEYSINLNSYLIMSE